MLFAIIFLLIFVFLIFMFILSVRALRQSSKAKKALKMEMDNKVANYGALASAALSTVSGLPFPDQTPCQVYVTDNQLIIEAQSQLFQIETDKIIIAQTKTDVEIQQEITSSAGKAIAGALLFGTAGAIIGGRPKTKKTAIVSYFLVINYTNQSGEITSLVFEGHGNAMSCKVISNALDAKIQQLRIGSVTNL